MKLGARIVKTGFAIVLAIYVARLLHMPAPVFAAISAIFAIQPTIYRSYLTILEQVQANIVGAFIAVTFVLLFGNAPFIIGLTAIIVISINLKLKMENTISIALVTVIAIMENQSGDFLTFALIRFSTILLGIVSAFIVNLVFLPPKYETKLFYRISSITEDIFKWIRFNTRHASDHNQLKNDIIRLKESIIKIEQLYIMYKEERIYFKRASLAKSRKLVVYRQMLFTTRKAFETLKRLHKYENELQQMPEIFQNRIQEQMDLLIYHHEQILLKYIGKMKSPSTAIDIHHENKNKQELVILLFDQPEKLKPEDQYLLHHMMPLVASIIEYGEQIEHLDKLICSFHSYHTETNEIPEEESDE